MSIYQPLIGQRSTGCISGLASSSYYELARRRTRRRSSLDSRCVLRLSQRFHPRRVVRSQSRFVEVAHGRESSAESRARTTCSSQKHRARLRCLARNKPASPSAAAPIARNVAVVGVAFESRVAARCGPETAGCPARACASRRGQVGAIRARRAARRRVCRKVASNPPLEFRPPHRSPVQATGVARRGREAVRAGNLARSSPDPAARSAIHRPPSRASQSHDARGPRSSGANCADLAAAGRAPLSPTTGGFGSAPGRNAGLECDSDD